MSCFKRVGMFILAMTWANSAFAVGISDVEAVNVTPSGFSVAARVTSQSLTDISVYADADGKTNLAGLVGVEYYPVNTGSPGFLNSYDQRQKKAGLVLKTKSSGLFLARVSLAQPGTTYYYRLHSVATNGAESIWPLSGKLPPVTTASANSFVARAKQLVVELPGTNVEGLIVTLGTAQAPYRLASVAGDGAPTNQVFFNLSELLSGAGGTNLDFLGSHEFRVEALGGPDAGSPNLYTLAFPPGFNVGSPSFDTLNLLTLTFGSTVLSAGQSGLLPITYGTRGAISSLSFTLDIPANRLTNLVLQPLAAAIQSVSLVSVTPTRSLATFVLRPGQTLQGTQELANLSFNTLSAQSSAILRLLPANIIAVKPDSSQVGEVLAEPGQLTIVADGPLLVANLEANVVRTLTLYGKPGANYQMQYSYSLQSPLVWSNWTTVSLSAISQTFSALSTTNPTVFFNARQLSP